MKLSIGMIVKNEEKYLRRCLEAISPILQQVDSELIITDTGSTDSTVDIAQEFTDNVLHFEWCNNFAAARNTGLRRAKGDWFMYLDADEILEDCSDLINFFNSGEYLKYNSARINIRSYNVENSSTGAVFLAIRLARRARDIRFINKIHERLDPLKVPMKELDMVANHYGYVIENNAERIEEKVERNLKIMFGLEKKNPRDCFNIFNICQTFAIGNRLEEALEYCERGLNYSKEQRGFYTYSFYANKVLLLCKMGRTRDALDTTEEYFSFREGEPATDLEMYYYQVSLHTEFNEIDESIEPIKNYLRMFVEVKNGMHRTPDYYQHSVNFTSDTNYKTAAIDALNLFVRTERLEDAEKVGRTLLISEFQDDDAYIQNILKIETVVMALRNDFTFLPELYDTLNSANKAVLESISEEYAGLSQYRENIAKAFYENTGDRTVYKELMRLRYLYMTGSVTNDDVAVFLENVDEWRTEFADAFYIALDTGAAMDILMKKLDAYSLNSAVCISTYGSWLKAVSHVDTSGSKAAEKQLWTAKLCECLLTGGFCAGDERLDIFKAFAAHFRAYSMNTIKDDTVRENGLEVLPAPLRLGYACGRAAAYREKGQKVDTVQCLKEILAVAPYFRDIIQQLLDEMRDEETRNELTAAQNVVKRNIQVLYKENETEKAMKLIEEYEKLCPDDEEMALLRSKLAEKCV